MLQTIGERCAGGGKGGNRVRLGLWVSLQRRGGQVQQTSTTWFFVCEAAIWLWLRPSAILVDVSTKSTGSSLVMKDEHELGCCFLPILLSLPLPFLFESLSPPFPFLTACILTNLKHYRVLPRLSRLVMCALDKLGTQ